MTKCHAVPAKTIKLSYGSGPLHSPVCPGAFQKKPGAFLIFVVHYSIKPGASPEIVVHF